MKKTFRFLLALLTAIVLMMAVRALVATLLTVEGNGLEPAFIQGDRVLVNRWSYGLRVGGSSSLFNYGRICKQSIEKGDLVVFENPQDASRKELFVCRCAALPGDSVDVNGIMMAVPSLDDCADADYYWLESVNPDNPIDSRHLGFIAEEYIIGRAVLVVYSRDPAAPLWKGWRTDRLLLPI